MCYDIIQGEKRKCQIVARILLILYNAKVPQSKMKDSTSRKKIEGEMCDECLLRHEGEWVKVIVILGEMDPRLLFFFVLQ